MDTPRLPAYRLPQAAVLHDLKTTTRGLTSEEAGKRLAANGPNVLAANKRESKVITYLRQFKDLMIILLLASGVLSWYLEDGRTGLVLIVLALFNTTIGFLQEYKAEKVMQSLEKLVVATARVRRGGTIEQVPTAGLVIGDIVYVEEGDSVPADLRLIEEEELSTNDFALTGESNPSRKFLHPIDTDTTVGGRGNLVFMGTTVATGHGYGVVIATGMNTELGRIASLSAGTHKESSPLQKEMNNIARRVTQGVMVLCLLMLPIAIQTGLPFREAFLFAIGIACSVIPNGLPAAISTSLARAAGKLARRRALVKKLSAVETLGATSVICTDKTGTLTKNQMTVEQITVGRTSFAVSGKGYEPAGAISGKDGQPLAAKDAEHHLSLFVAAGAMASNARIHQPDDEHAVWYCIGDPTEGALISLAMKGGFNAASLDETYPELKEFAFDSGRKRMSSVRHFGPQNKLHVFAKGAPESILDCCTHIRENGQERPLTKADRQFIAGHADAQAASAMRNLGVAYRILPDTSHVHTLDMKETESKLVWLGMASMIDPLRPDVPAAMVAAHKAHIKVSIVTGDHAVTAKAIATRAGLAPRPEDILVITGEELAALPDKEIVTLVARGGIIFSRVAPEDKLRIVSLVQDSGQVVAVTGDGINDAPALKRADIGVAMGQTGTDVAKQSAEIVLLDDSFNTLVKTVQEGRVIFQNIKKVTLCCFTGNAAELVVILSSLAAFSIFGVPMALTVIQILAIDVIAELFPVAAMGADKADGEVMTEKPRDPRAHILTWRSLGDIIWCGLLIGGLAFTNYWWFFERNHMDPTLAVTGSPDHLQAMSLTYLTLVLCLLLNVLQRRSVNGLFTRYQLHNRSMWIAIALSLFSVLNILYNPWVAPYFQTAPLGWVDWGYALAAALIFIIVREFTRHNKKHSRRAVLELHRRHAARQAA